MKRIRGGISLFPIVILLLVFFSTSLVFGQTIEIIDNKNQVLNGIQVVNVGEHIRAQVRVQPSGTSFSNPQWLVTGPHIKDWTVKEMQKILMGVNDYLGEEIHFIWKEVTLPNTPNVLRVSLLVGGTIMSAQVSFQVERYPKPEKFYSDDLLMEYHNNWHSVYQFGSAALRRGDLFLSWHRSQLEYFNAWRSYFGYPPTPNWEPTQPWVLGIPVPARQHPSQSPLPMANFSDRHDLDTLDLTNQNLATTSEGEFDLVTQSLSRGTTGQFISAGYVLRTETIKNILGIPNIPEFSKIGVASLPEWWKPNTGQAGNDPWFALGCPNPAQTCAPTNKKSFDDYTLRELGESIESGWYANDFRVNYHAFGHVAASEDMGNPVTSMRDPIFWGWHNHIDGILSAWQKTKGVEAAGPLQLYRNPDFLNNWSTLQVYFTNRAVADFVLPENVRVNGSPATQVQDVSFTGTGYIFQFSGFSVPPDGSVEVVILREVENGIRTSASDPRPQPTLIMSTFGNLLTPAVIRRHYNKP